VWLGCVLFEFIDVLCVLCWGCVSDCVMLVCHVDV